jgi:Domain of unknown function (DUF4037)
MSGIELSRALFEEAVQPILQAAYPSLRYAAARIGSGSEVLGFDTARSADHEWGPRLDLFLCPDNLRAHGQAIRDLLGEQLPPTIEGWPTNFRESDDPADPVGRMELAKGRVNHRVGVSDLGSWLSGQLGVEVIGRDLAVEDWLAMPQQRLAEVVGGAVFRDDDGQLAACREALAWYPDQVWRYLLACQWQKIAQEEAFVGRCVEVGDELGSRVVSARLVRELMRLALLLQRRYAPYSKWLGSAFVATELGRQLQPLLLAATTAEAYPNREAALCSAYEAALTWQNGLGLTEPIDPACRDYYGRPYKVIHAGRIVRALRETLTDAELRSRPLVGSVDQWADSTDVLHERPAITAATQAITRDGAAGARHE